MTPEEFRREAHRLVDWIADYRAEIEDRPVMAQVEPGRIKAMLPEAAPETPESFEAIFTDIDRIVAPGLSHFQHPSFFGYFPANADLAAVLGDFRPLEAAVEQTFVNKDGVATLKLGQARGVAMLAPAMFGVSVAEYAPNQVKKTVVGAGHADKTQIQAMLKILLPKATPESADAADALAIAITHAHHRGSAALRMKVAG